MTALEIESGMDLIYKSCYTSSQCIFVLSLLCVSMVNIQRGLSSLGYSFITKITGNARTGLFFYHKILIRHN
jgi:hypothetical protein